MKVIKVKIKTILLIGITIFIAIPYLMYFIGEIGYSSNINLGGNHLRTYTAGALKIYDGWPTIKINKGRTKYLLGMSNYNYNEEVLVGYTNGNSTFKNKYGNMEQALIAKSYFEEGIDQGESSSYYKYNINALINLEITLGNNNESLKLIEKAKSSDKIEISEVGILNEVAYYGKIGDYNKALDICNSNKAKIPVLYNYINTISYMKGDFNILNENRNNLYKKNEFGYLDNTSETSDSKILSDISFVKKIEIFSNGDWNGEGVQNTNILIDDNMYKNLKFGKISGTIISKGIKVPNAKVVLSGFRGMSTNVIEDNSFSIGPQELYSEQVVYANKDGEFIFNNVRTDTNYSIGVFLPSIYGDGATMKAYENNYKVLEGETLNIDVIFKPMINVTKVEVDKENDEIVVNYESAEGATSYGLIITEGGASAFGSPITEKNEIRVPLSGGAMQSYAMSVGGGEDEDLGITRNAKSLLGFINGETIYVGVIAYDDNKTIVSKSSFFENKLKLNKKKYNEGEKLILNGDEKDGFNWIYNSLLEDPMNEDYIYPIMRLAIEKRDFNFARELVDRLEEINKTGFDREYYSDEIKFWEEIEKKEDE